MRRSRFAIGIIGRRQCCRRGDLRVLVEAVGAVAARAVRRLGKHIGIVRYRPGHRLARRIIAEPLRHIGTRAGEVMRQCLQPRHGVIAQCARHDRSAAGERCAA
mgnify:CR=1 FL=1